MNSSNHQIITVSSPNVSGQWSTPKRKYIESESGLSLLARLGTRPSLLGIDSSLFHDGPQPGDVIEITGTPGTGKSLLCLHLIASALLPKTWKGAHIKGCESGVILIDTDHHFNILQLENVMQKKITIILKRSKSVLKGKCARENEHELIANREDLKTFLQSGSQYIKDELAKLTKNCLKNLSYLKCSDSTQFAITLLSLNEVLQTKEDAALIVTDSISAFYWYDHSYRSASWYKLEQYYNNIFKVFLEYIKKYKVTLVATRQMLFQKKSKDDTISKQTNNPEEEESEEGPGKYEYMGKEWSSSVSCRVNLSITKCLILGIGVDKCEKVAFEVTDEVSKDIDKTHRDNKSEVNITDRPIYCADLAEKERKSKLTFTIHEEGIRWKI